ncbi:hypothetical protein JHK86_016304 [Glycine max]|nr:hypothetical protein JHK86_016304 [Glycine max]
MCVCCPALRSRSRQPVKRYRKLLADIFPKSPDESPSERKITKLCEYAAKNPFRIPKIAKYLEERCYKELRYEHLKLVNIIAESFNKLLSICKVQIAYFAVDVLNVILELLSYSKDETIQTLGCQCLSKFIYCQMDATYTHNIEKLVPKVCMLSREHGEACEKRCLRASSLQCLSAMANGGVEGHDALPMQGPSLLDFFPLWLTAVLKVTALCHARAFFVRFFFRFGYNIALDGKEANGGAEDDGVLPCKGLLCSVFFFRFGFYVALDGKKDGEAASEEVTNSYHVLRQIE